MNKAYLDTFNLSDRHLQHENLYDVNYEKKNELFDA